MSTTQFQSALAVENAILHAIFLLDENGVITSWNGGASRIFGYAAEDIIGCSTAVLFTPEDVRNGAHADEMRRALRDGYAGDDRWHLRRDGSRFWASGTLTPAYDQGGRLQGFVKIARDKTVEKLANERALHLARHDALTGLPNRSMFQEQLKEAIGHANLGHSMVQVLLIDLDRFKEINDTYGHHVGDIFLKQVAARLEGMVRTNDLVARLGGDEFGVICQTTLAKADSVVLAEKLVDQLALPYQVEGKELFSGASVGLTVYPMDTRQAEQLMKNADLAMYAAKRDGRSTYRRYSEDLDADARRRRRIAEWLPVALDNDGLMLHYLPQYSLVNGTVTSVEALLRWRDCPVADLDTEEIISTAAEVGLTEALTEWTLFTACNQAKAWRAEGMDTFRIAINISSSQLNAVSFLKLIDKVLQQTGVTAGCLELEITESMLLEKDQAHHLLFRSLKKKGVKLVVDDFGTGSSSLSSLRNFPVDTLKIDREFVRSLPSNEHDAAIASAIIGLAHSLNLTAAAEGIERTEQAELLASLGCDFGQGYLFGEPLPAEEVWRQVDYQPT